MNFLKLIKGVRIKSHKILQKLIKNHKIFPKIFIYSNKPYYSIK